MTRIQHRWFDRTYPGRFAFVEAHLPPGPARVLNVGHIGADGFSSWDRIVQVVRERRGEIVGCDVTVAGSGPTPEVGGDLRALPFASSSFGCVYLGELIEHIWDPRSALSEVRRVLQDGGTLLLDTPNAFSLGNMLNWWLRHLDDLGDPDHKQVFTPASLALVVGESGFRVKEILTDRKLSVGRAQLPWVPGARRLGSHLLLRAVAC